MTDCFWIAVVMHELPKRSIQNPRELDTSLLQLDSHDGNFLVCVRLREDHGRNRHALAGELGGARSMLRFLSGFHRQHISHHTLQAMIWPIRNNIG